MATTSDDLRMTPSQAMDDMASPEFYDCFSSPKPLITPSKLFLGDCADEKAIDWTILENCNPNLVETPKSVQRNSETKKIRKSLIPIFSPTPSERQPTGVLTASGSRSSKSRRISKEITEVLASRASSSGRKSTTDRDPLGLRDISQSKEIAELKEKVAVLEAQNKSYETTIGGLQSKLTEQETLNAALRDEISAVCFFTQVQGQKIEEQESLLMTSKMDYQEEVSAKNRKYKTMIKKMQAEKASYENGANAIIKQLNEQMAELQKVALTRIQTLETQLMEYRRAKDLLAKENVDLKALVSEQERALQERETSASTSSSTAASSGARSPLPASSSSSQARSLSPMAVARAHLHHMAAARQPGRPAASTPKRGSTDEDDDEDDHTATPPAVNRRHPLTNKADVIASLAVSSPSFEA